MSDLARDRASEGCPRARWLDDLREAAWAIERALPAADRANHLWRYTDPAEFLLPDGAGIRQRIRSWSTSTPHPG